MVDDRWLPKWVIDPFRRYLADRLDPTYEVAAKHLGVPEEISALRAALLEETDRGC